MARKLLKLIHPEGIPFPGSTLYSALTRGRIFQNHYALVAQDIVRQCPRGRMADIGTGPGWLLIHLKHLAPDLDLTGVDISSSMVRRAKVNMNSAGLTDLPIVLGDAKRLPFADASLDAVVSTGSIHHWKDSAAALREIHRILAPHGLARIYDIVRDTPREVLDRLRQEYGRWRWWMFWLHAFEEPFLSVGELTDLARKSPFGPSPTRFVGVLCCLQMKKSSSPDT